MNVLRITLPAETGFFDANPKNSSPEQIDPDAGVPRRQSPLTLLRSFWHQSVVA